MPGKVKFNAVILAVAHEQYKKFSFSKWNSLTCSDGIIFDLKGLFLKKLQI